VSTTSPIPPRAEAPHAAELADVADAADRDAVGRTLDGDVEAFAAIVRRHGSGLVSLCAHLAGNRHLGEELAQEALARAFSGLGSWRGDGRFRYWLFRIARNCCRDYLKSGARAEQPGEPVHEEAAAARDPERELAGRQLAVALEAAVAKLPEPYREAFLLFHAEDMAYHEIREITGASIGALKVRVHRARVMLRRSVAGLLDSSEE
jgi:RNA polymerase sigma-70 factor (ECF subfamily)